ncbi:tetratricopeptide repeat protein [Aureimonas psammosilenae]|uniref:tetratricopeptide repeat protein n=1 Tax=Aureimonas psammosilenae TaxID=2495496 RepID=UPI00186A9F3B|nr:tetratricopeptide repeat protein [Aureimonas psammosilenae]
MSDETFFREVNEEIRQQRVHDLWRRFGRWLIVAAVVLVIATGAYLAYRQYTVAQANAAGDRFIAAVDLADADKFDEAVTQLDAIAKSGAGSYPLLADLRLASIRARQGDLKGAFEGFDKVAKDTNAPKALRDIAAIRAGYVLVDTGSVDEVRAEVERLSGDSEPLRFAAREAMGLASWKAGNLDEARRFLTQNRDDQGAPAGIGLRARILMELVDAGTTPASAAEAAAATPAAPAAPAAPEILPSPIPLDLEVPAAPGVPDASVTVPEAPAVDVAPAAPPSPVAPVAPVAPIAPPVIDSPATTEAPVVPQAPAADPAPAIDPAPTPSAEPAPAAPATQAPPAGAPAAPAN